jgi:hypothetical protein
VEKPATLTKIIQSRSARKRPQLARFFYFGAEQNQNDSAEVKVEIKNKLKPRNFDLIAIGLM